MLSSTFNAFEQAICDRPQAFPAIRSRVAWRAFRRFFQAIINEPVWSPLPATFSEWQNQLINKSRAEALQHLLPPETAPAFEALPQEISLPRLFDWLEGCHNRISHDLRDGLQAAPRAVASGAKQPASLSGRFSKCAPVDHLIEKLRNPPGAIRSTLLHGSLADGLTAEGFSDADVLCILAAPGEKPGDFWAAAQWLHQLNHYLFAINPCMHHGPMVAFAGDLERTAEAHLPSAVLKHGIWIHGPTDHLLYFDGLYENIMALADFESYFERHHLLPIDLKHAFDVLWWTSNTLLLPVLLQQVATGVSVYKRECLTENSAGLAPRFTHTLQRVSEVRECLGNWISSRLPSEIAIDLNANPGQLVARFRQKLALTASDARSLGVPDDLMAEVRALWDYVRTTSLEIGFNRIGPDFRTQKIHWHWPRPLDRMPRRLTHSDYDRAREDFVARCRAHPEIRAAFEFGEVGCPGLSDLDFCVVLEDNYLGIPKFLRASAFPEDTAYIIGHDPLFVSARNTDQLGAFFPIYAARQLHGAAMELPLSESFPREFRAASFTYKNLRKYPNDLDWLLSQDTLNVRALLGVLHSAQHIQRGLEQLGIAPPEQVSRAVVLDAELRGRFATSAEPVSAADILRVVEICTAFCAPLHGVLLEHWLGKATGGAPQNTRSARSELQDRQWLLTELSPGAQPSKYFRNRPPTIFPVIAAYLEKKEAFCVFEQERDRPPSRYICDPDAAESAQSAQTSREELKNRCNLLQAQLADLQRNFLAVEADRLARGNVIEEQGRKFSALEAEFDSRLNELANLYSSIEALKNERNLLQAQLVDLQRNFDAVEADRIARGEVIAHQGRQSSELQRLVHLTEANRDWWKAEAERRAGDAAARVAELNVTVDHLTERSAKDNERLDMLQLTLAHHNAEYEKLRSRWWFRLAHLLRLQ